MPESPGKPLTSVEAIYQALNRARSAQARTPDAQARTAGEWLLQLDAEVQMAKVWWLAGDEPRHLVRALLRALAAGVACLEHYELGPRED